MSLARMPVAVLVLAAAGATFCPPAAASSANPSKA